MQELHSSWNSLHERLELVQVVRTWTQWRTRRYARLNLNERTDLFFHVAFARLDPPLNRIYNMLVCYSSIFAVRRR